MAYKVKNISTKVFAFEGITIQPGEVSLELTLDVYQRLLALNYGTALMPVEEGEEAPPDVVEPEAVEEDFSPEPTAVQEAQVEAMKDAIVEGMDAETGLPIEDLSSGAETVEVSVEVNAPAVADVPVEAPKKRGRPRKNP